MQEENKNYPKTYRENMAWRAQILRRCSLDPTYREQVRELFFRDPLFAFNAFFFTYDPRKRPFHQQPFCTYSFQDDFILGLVKAINEGEDYLAEKSRDMGVSWCVILVFLWNWLNPTGGSDFLCGSRIEDYVDKKGDMRTLIEKARYTLYRLPKWLRPKGFIKNKHDNFMRLQNPETGASITGESNNANFSTGGRYAGILLDEFAKWESTDESAWTAAGDASPCRIPVSTPFGAGGQYYNLVTDGKTEKMTLHWTLHPEKALGLYCVWPAPNWKELEEGSEDEPEVELRSPWYDKQCERRSATEIAQELDIDYLGAGNPVFDGKAGASLRHYMKLKREPLEYIDPLSGKAERKVKDLGGLLAIYKQPSKDCTYVIAADVAEGKIDGDFSVAKVFNRETKDIDATFFGLVDEVGFAFVIKAVAELYSNLEGIEYPWVAIETNGPGLATFDKCLDLQVANLFMMPRYEVAREQVTYRKGWVTSQGSRNALVAGIKEYLIDRIGFIDPRCVGELGTFVRNKTGKAAAKAGCHDDEVMCFGIAIQVDQIAPYTGPSVVSVNRNIREVIGSIDEAEVVEEQSIEAKCMAQAIERQELVREAKEMDFESSIDEMFEDW